MNSRSAMCWQEVPELINARPAETETVVYGISRSICGKQLMIDFGNELGNVATMEITYRNERDAWGAYCRGIRVALKVVKHPEQDL